MDGLETNCPEDGKEIDLITENEFRSVTIEDVFVDAYDRRWQILKVLDTGKIPSLWVQCPEHEAEEVSFFDGSIVDEEVGILIELNHASARVEKA